jgi:preprotein translocase subunit SecG
VRTAITWITVIVNVAAMLGMVVTILMHSGRGGGLSDMFGGASGTALGSTAAEKNLTRITVVLALIWVFTVVGLGLLLD